MPVDGSFSIEPFAAWPTTSQRNLATFGSLATVAKPSQALDAKFSVTADGTLIDCAAGLAPACGNGYFFFAVCLMTGAENSGLADVSPGLNVDALRGASGAPLAFAPSAIRAVPEPGSGASLLGAAGNPRCRSQR